MSDATEPLAAGTRPATDEDQAIRERVRELTTQVLRQGRVDTERVRDVVRAVTGFPAPEVEPPGLASRQALAEAVRALDTALVQSAGTAHAALERLASKGGDFTDNDLKDALVSLKKLEEDYLAIAARVTEAVSGNLRKEMAELAVRAQSLGADASARLASTLGELANRMGESATTGFSAMRGASVRMALLASGLLAGVADALQEQSKTKTGE